MLSKTVRERIENKLSEFGERAQSVKTVADAENLCMTHREAWGLLFPDWDDFLQGDDREFFRSFVDGLPKAIEAMKSIEASAGDHEFLLHAVESTRIRTEAFRELFAGNEENAMECLEKLLQLT